MPVALASSLADLLLGLDLGSADQETRNRFSFDGLSMRPAQEGALEIGIRRVEAASLRIASGPFVLELGRCTVNQLVAQARIEDGKPRLQSLEAASAELAGVKLHGSLVFPGQAKRGGAPGAQAAATAPPPAAAVPGEAAADPWCLGPLAAADGTVRAKILDAHLMFDADVTVPVRQGRVDFNQATVEHVGPDSRMGVSRMGLYVDAPNGRSYLYQFSAAPVEGVEFERRGAMLGARVTNRGNLQLQPLGEGLLRQAGPGAASGFTAQSRLLLDRTAVTGDVQLGDGSFRIPGVHAELAGRAQGRNAVRLHSEAVGRGLTIQMTALSVRNAVLKSRAAQLAAGEITGPLTLRLFVQAGQLRFALDLADMKLSRLRLEPQGGTRA